METIEALKVLALTQLNHQVPTDETLTLTSRETKMALAVAGDRSKAYAEALVYSALADGWLNRAAEGRSLAERALSMAQGNLHDLDVAQRPRGLDTALSVLARLPLCSPGPRPRETDSFTMPCIIASCMLPPTPLS
jgi:hypothetical protein